MRLDPAVEAAAYFTCLEALQNAAPHAPHAPHATHATVRIDLRLTGDVLSWSVSDDGPGLAPAVRTTEGGLASMRERVLALAVTSR